MMKQRPFPEFVDYMELVRKEQNLSVDARIASRELNDYLNEHEMKEVSQYDTIAKALTVKLCEIRMERCKVRERIEKEDYMYWFTQKEEMI